MQVAPHRAATPSVERRRDCVELLAVDLRERLASYERAGVDLALLRLAGTPDEQLAIISAL